MPWVLMLRGPTPASQSIYLDYVSKWNIVSLYQSLRQRHFLVSLCVAGSLLLNGITAFSTGLFELDSVHVTDPVELMVSNKFGRGNYDPASHDDKTFAMCMAFASRNMTPPTGIHKNYVYTTFIPADLYSMKNEALPSGRQLGELTFITPPFNI